jgi:hypothetical protein
MASINRVEVEEDAKSPTVTCGVCGTVLEHDHTFPLGDEPAHP